MAAVDTPPFDLDDWCALCGGQPEHTYGRRKDPLCTECLDHIRGGRCTSSECIPCGYRDCTHNEPLHYDDDGCPMQCGHQGAELVFRNGDIFFQKPTLK